MRRMAGDSNMRRLMSNLRRHPAAMAALGRLGIEPATVETFGLGLREPVRRADGRIVDGVLSYALLDDGGRRRFGCVALDGVTSNGEHAVAWSAGRPATVRWCVGRGTTIVCGSPVQAWQLGQAAERARLAVTTVASSQPEAAPAEWSDPAYWSAERVVVTDEVSPALRRLVLDRCRGTAEVAAGVACPAEGALSVAERHDVWLSEILELSIRHAPAVTTEAAGDFAAEPVPVNGGFAGGFMLHPFAIERRREQPGEAGGAPRLVYSVETLVLRSDGEVLEGRVLPAPRGTPFGSRVHALTDGTRIDGPPRATAHGAWSLPSIRAFIAARAAGDDPCVRASAATLADVRAFLASRVALPDPDDLWTATAFVALTHMFRAFDALPILRIMGAKGSGKSELGVAVAALSYGGVVMGQGTAAALVRLAGACGGLVVLDDAECLGTEAGGFGELAQCLKIGHKAATARKPVVVGGGRVEVMDFFGPRVVTATRNVDPILGSRCITIATEAVDRPLLFACDVNHNALRDELRTLAMARSGEVERRYRELMDERGGRADEIRAPLIAIAEVLGGEAMRAALSRGPDRGV